jgi:predicted transcriptional regulator
MAIPEFTRSLTIRVPDDVRSKLESMSLKEDKPLSRVVRAVIAEGLKRRVASEDEFLELEA